MDNLSKHEEINRILNRIAEQRLKEDEEYDWTNSTVEDYGL